MGLLGAGLAGCSRGSTAPAVCAAQQAPASAANALAADDTQFAFALFDSVTGDGGATGNEIVSPYSVSATLMMVDVGAASTTSAQIQSVLRLPADGSQLASSYAALGCQDETDGTGNGNQLVSANGLWLQQGTAVESSFQSTLAEGYGAPLHEVDFAGAPAAATTAVNQWVSSETDGLISQLLSAGDVDTSTRLVLVDAIYFAGTWDVGFNPSDTAPQPFVLGDGTTVQVPTMYGVVNLATGESPGGVLYELPYRGGDVVMDLILPADSASGLGAGLDPGLVSTCLSALGQQRQVQLALPKFAFETRLVLRPVLESMGITALFDPASADLSGISQGAGLYVATVVHDAQVQVNEEGTVAAAATAATGAVKTCEGCGAGPPLVEIDRPFWFLIRDTRNGGILFMGQVSDPREGT
jgi:serpin B